MSHQRAAKAQKLRQTVVHESMARVTLSMNQRQATTSSKVKRMQRGLFVDKDTLFSELAVDNCRIQREARSIYYTNSRRSSPLWVDMAWVLSSIVRWYAFLMKLVRCQQTIICVVIYMPEPIVYLPSFSDVSLSLSSHIWCDISLEMFDKCIKGMKKQRNRTNPLYSKDIFDFFLFLSFL